VTLDRRGEVLASLLPPLRPAAVSIPLYRAATGDLHALVSRRARINGHTGEPMLYGGEVVLFGGAVDAAETPLDAAIRELREETTPRPQDRFADARPLPRATPGGWIGRWIVESGEAVDGFLLHLQGAVVRERVGWNRGEVDGVASIRVADVAALEPRLVATERYGTTRDGRRFRGMFETLHYTVVDQWGSGAVDLWGAAGFMFARLTDRIAVERTPARVRAAQWRTALEISEFLRDVLRVPPPVFVEAPRLSEELGHRVVLQLEATLPPARSGKIRSVASLVWHAARSVLASPDGARLSIHDALAEAFAGRTLVTASTGSHARAVVELARWLRARGIDVETRLFVSSDVSPEKTRALAGTIVVVPGDFSAATDVALADCARRSAAGERCMFLPTDPTDDVDPEGRFSGSDGLAGFATTAGDALAWIAEQHRRSGLATPRVDAMYIPTSGGATWAACRAHVAAEDALGARDAQIGEVIGVGDAAANPVRASFEAGRLVEVDPFAPGHISGLAQRRMSPVAFDLVRDLSVRVESGSEAFIPRARALVFADIGLDAEPAGAITIAYALQQAARGISQHGVAIHVVSGAWVPQSLHGIAAALSHGMSVDTLAIVAAMVPLLPDAARSTPEAALVRRAVDELRATEPPFGRASTLARAGVLNALSDW
jgi:threonine dehydratase/8-oxo-dGTP pyrophosphatase MutT (NUDIX family)